MVTMMVIMMVITIYGDRVYLLLYFHMEYVLICGFINIYQAVSQTNPNYNSHAILHMWFYALYPAWFHIKSYYGDRISYSTPENEGTV